MLESRYFFEDTPFPICYSGAASFSGPCLRTVATEYRQVHVQISWTRMSCVEYRWDDRSIEIKLIDLD